MKLSNPEIKFAAAFGFANSEACSQTVIEYKAAPNFDCSADNPSRAALRDSAIFTMAIWLVYLSTLDALSNAS